MTVRRERFQATWVVEVDDGPEAGAPGDPPPLPAAVLPVAPGRMREVIELTAARLLELAKSDARMGAVTVVSMPEHLWPRLPLPMIGLPSGHVGPGHGGGRAPR